MGTVWHVLHKLWDIQPWVQPALAEGLPGAKLAAPPKSRLAASDQARSAVAREVVVHPLGEYQQAIVELHQVHEMYEDPGEPGGESGDVQLAEFGHGLVAANRGQIALIEVTERRGRCAGRCAAGHAAANQPGDLAALLHGHRRHPGQRLAALVGEAGEVADDEDLGVPGDARSEERRG